MGLLLRHRAQPDRPRRLPRQARRHRPAAPVGGGRHAHRAASARRDRLYLDSWSDITTPTQVRVHRADGIPGPGDRREPGRRRSPSTGWPKPEFLQVKTRDGFVMEAMMIKPPDFDPSRRYPVYQFTYGGPARASRCATRWGGTEYHVPPAARAAAASSSGSATTAPRAARAPSRRGRSTGTSASSSCATSRTAWRGSKQAAVGRRDRASASTAGATAAS